MTEEQARRAEVVRCIDTVMDMIKHYDLPFVFAIQLTNEYVTSYWHIPEHAVSELRCAAYELGVDE